MHYIQCELEKPAGDEAIHETSWIPAKYAVLDKYIKLKINKIWDDGWKVTYVGTKMKEEDLFRDEYCYYRDITDI